MQINSKESLFIKSDRNVNNKSILLPNLNFAKEKRTRSKSNEYSKKERKKENINILINNGDAAFPPDLKRKNKSHIRSNSKESDENSKTKEDPWESQDEITAKAMEEAAIILKNIPKVRDDQSTDKNNNSASTGSKYAKDWAKTPLYKDFINSKLSESPDVFTEDENSALYAHITAQFEADRNCSQIVEDSFSKTLATFHDLMFSMSYNSQYSAIKK